MLYLLARHKVIRSYGCHRLLSDAAPPAESRLVRVHEEPVAGPVRFGFRGLRDGRSLRRLGSQPLTSRAADMFRAQPGLEQQKLLRLVLRSASWKGGALRMPGAFCRVTTFEPRGSYKRQALAAHGRQICYLAEEEGFEPPSDFRH